MPVEDLEKAAETYTVPEIEIVEPRLVVCLGLAVYRAIRKSFGLAPAGNLEMAIASPFRIGDAQFWAQSSPGALGRANRNRGGVDRVAEDWRRMADAVQWDVSRGRPILYQSNTSTRTRIETIHRQNKEVHHHQPIRRFTIQSTADFDARLSRLEGVVEQLSQRMSGLEAGQREILMWLRWIIGIQFTTLLTLGTLILIKL